MLLQKGAAATSFVDERAGTRSRPSSHRYSSLAATTALALLMAAGPAQCAEPVYHGKALTEWLVELNENPSQEEVLAALRNDREQGLDPLETVYENKRKRDQAAIRQFGTNALPTLLEMLGVTDRNGKRTVARLRSERLRAWYGRDESDMEDLRMLAVEGFEILGTNAALAVPQLTKLFHNPETSHQAARALTKVGPAGFSVLTNALSARNGAWRSTAIWVLGQEAGVDSKTVDGLLIGRLADPDIVNRHNAAQFLSGKDPSAIPVLIKMLDDEQNYLAVSGAADGLKSFGSAAKAAAPKLLAIYTNHVVDPDGQAARSWGVTLMWALKAIDMETAAKAESFLVNSGPLNYARNGHTVTSLKNGKELIVGGYVHTEIPAPTNRFLSSVELRDPVTGKWKATGGLKEPRNSHTATLLRNGKVMIVGGMDVQGHALATAALYDPATERWTDTDPLKKERFYHTATLQSDGKVLVDGGHDGRNPVSSQELYDPTIEKWLAP